MSRILKSSQEISEIVLGLHKKGLSDRRISEDSGIIRETVAVHRRRLGLKPNGNGPRKLDRVSETEARCSKCVEVKPLTEFTVNRRGKAYSYHLSYCFKCRKIQAIAAVNRSKSRYLNYLVVRLRQKCKARKIFCDITLQDVEEMWGMQKGLCLYTDLPLVYEVGNGYDRQRCSLDRIVPERGYTASNIVLCTQKANTVKNDLSLEEMRLWTPGWHERLVVAGKIAA